MASKHVTLRLTPAELSELTQLRGVLERKAGKPVALQAAMRIAILSHPTARLERKEYQGTRSVRIDLLANDDVQAALKRLQSVNAGLSIADIVLCTARILIAKPH